MTGEFLPLYLKPGRPHTGKYTVSQLRTLSFAYITHANKGSNKQDTLGNTEDTARYADLLLAPAEDFGLRPRLFCPSGKKRAVLAHFRPFLVSSSNLGNF